MYGLTGRYGMITHMEERAQTVTSAVKSKRVMDTSIESLRGLAVLLMVAGHIIGSSTDAGMHAPEGSVWWYFYVLLQDIRMPLFTVLSGFIYAQRPIRSRTDYPGMIRGKTVRLIFPLITVGALLFAMQYFTPSANSKRELSEFWKTYAFGYQHLWFLQSIFLIFLAVGVLDFLGALSSRRGYFAALGVTFALFVAVRVSEAWNIFSVNGAVRLLPFFLIGYGLKRYSIFDVRGRVTGVVVAVFAVVYALRLTEILNWWEPHPAVLRAMSLAVGVAAVVLIYSVRALFTNRPLSWIGGFSFVIFLLHVIGAALSTRIAAKLGIDSDTLVFLIGVTLAIALPIVAYVVFARFWPIRTYIFGEKRKLSASPPVVGR